MGCYCIWYGGIYRIVALVMKAVSSKLLGAHAYVQKAFLYVWYNGIVRYMNIAMFNVMVNDKEAMTTVSSPLL